MEIYIIEKKFKGNAMMPSSYVDMLEWTFDHWLPEPPAKAQWQDGHYYYRSTLLRAGERVENRDAYFESGDFPGHYRRRR